MNELAEKLSIDIWNLENNPDVILRKVLIKHLSEAIEQINSNAESSPEPTCSTRHDVLSDKTVEQLAEWARALYSLREQFNDDRSLHCQAASNLLFSIITKR